MVEEKKEPGWYEKEVRKRLYGKEFIERRQFGKNMKRSGAEDDVKEELERKEKNGEPIGEEIWKFYFYRIEGKDA